MRLWQLFVLIPNYLANYKQVKIKIIFIDFQIVALV